MAGEGRGRGPDAPLKAAATAKDATKGGYFASRCKERACARRKIAAWSWVASGPRGRSPSSAIQAIGETAVGAGLCDPSEGNRARSGVHTDEARVRRTQTTWAFSADHRHFAQASASGNAPGIRSMIGLAIGAAGPHACRRSHLSANSAHPGPPDRILSPSDKAARPDLGHWDDPADPVRFAASPGRFHRAGHETSGKPDQRTAIAPEGCGYAVRSAPG